MLSPQGWKTNVNGSGLWNMLQQSFAWIPTQGYTTRAGAVQKFPVIMSEIGSSLADEKVSQLLCTLCAVSAVYKSPSPMASQV